jgi:hypothetical protein
MAPGHHNGFNPFRDAHGRWATPGGAGVEHAQEPGKGSTSINDALRSASGRATGGGGGDGTPPSKGAAPFSAATLDAVMARPLTQRGLHPATIANLNDMLQTNDWQAAHDTLNGAAFHVLSQQAARATPEEVDTLIQAYKESGFDPPAASTTDLLGLMDHFNGLREGSDAEANLASYSIAAALKSGDQGVALTFADGPTGAGIGWDLTRQELLGNLV